MVVNSAETVHRWKCGAFNFRPKITIKHSIFEHRALNLPLDLTRNFGGAATKFSSSVGLRNSYSEIKCPHFRRCMGYASSSSKLDRLMVLDSRGTTSNLPNLLLTRRLVGLKRRYCIRYGAIYSRKNRDLSEAVTTQHLTILFARNTHHGFDFAACLPSARHFCRSYCASKMSRSPLSLSRSQFDYLHCQIGPTLLG